MSNYISPYSVQTMGRSGVDRVAYRDYLQNKSFVKDITDSNIEVQYAISESSREMIATHEQLQERGFELLESIDSGIAGVKDTLEDGFELVTYELENVSKGIKSLTAKCDWGFSRMIAKIGHVNDTLTELLSVAKTPAQTWAYNQFEIGRDAMRQELYPEALETILRAINGFGDQTGYKLEYRFHYNLGILHLGDVKNTDPAILDLAKAEQAFLSAARYAKADFPLEASVSFTAAGWAAYCQAKLPDAENYTRQAIQLDSCLENGEAYFQLAKVLMHTDRSADAISHLRKAIEIDRNYMLKAATDVDFLKYEKQMQALFETLRKESALLAEQHIDRSKQSVEFMQSWQTQENFPKETKLTIDLYSKALKEFKTNTYFGCLDATDLAIRVKNDVDAVVKQQKEKMSADIEKIAARVKENRSRIAAKASNFGVQKWQEAEAAYNQVSCQTFSGLSYEGYQSRFKWLGETDRLYLDSEREAQQTIDVSIADAEHGGKILGGLSGGFRGLLWGGIGGLIIAAIAESIIGRENGGSIVGFILLIIIVIGAVTFYARSEGSSHSKDSRRKREEEVRQIISNN